MKRTKEKAEMVNLKVVDACDVTRKARVQLAATDGKLLETQRHLSCIGDGNSRIAQSLKNIQDTSAIFHTAEARLTFEHARLKRACGNIRNSLDSLRASQVVLREKQEQSRRILAFSGVTTDLIERIEDAMQRGLPVDGLVAEAMELKDRHKRSRQ